MTTTPGEQIDSQPKRVDEALWQRQCALEAEMVGMGVERYFKRTNEAIEHGRESVTSYGQKIMAKCVLPLKEKIIEFMAVDRSNRSLPVAIKYLKQVTPELAAYATVKVVLDSLTKTNTLMKVSLDIASMLEDEVRFTAAETQNKALFQVVLRDLTRQGKDSKYKHKVLVHSFNRAGIVWENWPKTDKVLLGTKLVDLMSQISGLIQLEYDKVSRRRTYIRVVPFTPSPDDPPGTMGAAEWIANEISNSQLLSPVFLPTVIPPRPWTDPVIGGYHTPRRKRLRLVKTLNSNFIEEFRNSDVDLVYSTVNAIQAVPWKINENVLAVMQESWRNNSCLGGLPNQEPEPLPPKPVGIETDKVIRRKWRHAARHVHDANRKLESKRFQQARILQVANMFLEDEAIYFPHQLDFRGRIYAVPMFLNPQGPDASRALLHFAESKPLGNQSAADWLAIHGANLYGQDKCSFEERIRWVRDNESHILASAESPLDYSWWAKADSPWQFLAFCFEWKGYCTHSFEHETRLPIALDGSCNGLQHFSAMLRDPVGGAAVNLVPNEKPNDIYGIVAAKVVEKLQTSDSPYAATWLAFGIDRAICKRPVMVLPYGGTAYSCREYVRENVLEKVAHGKPKPFGDDFNRATAYLAFLIWNSIGEVVTSARDVMGWLQAVSRLVSKENLPVMWKAPSGFPVMQAYYDSRKCRVKTKLGNRSVKLNIEEFTNKIYSQHQAQGISPNFVHSLDASCLMFAVDAALKCGINSFAVIHDSYATHACDTTALAACIREAFIGVYQTDVLSDFLEYVKPMIEDHSKIPPMPVKGTLDLNCVRDSKFFFS